MSIPGYNNTVEPLSTDDNNSDSSFSYDFYHSPLGPLLLIANSMGLLKIAFDNEDFDLVVAEITRKFTASLCHDSLRFNDISQQLDQYFAGERQNFTIRVDYCLTAGFRKRVLQELVHVPYGETVSYQQLAIACDNPRAARAVGTACATNPLPIVIPCHRVIRADGNLGGYSGCLQKKKLLLTLEKAKIVANL